MRHRAIASLGAMLRPHLGLSKDRVETLAMIVIAMISARTVNLSHLAAERPGRTLVASTYRRLQRFFQYVRLEQDWAAAMVVGLAGLRGSNKWHLALDRTQWQIGGQDVNFLVLAAVTRRFRVPLMWTMIDGRGTSNTRQRIDLMRRYLGLFGVASIRMLLADREFVGREWTDFLCENNVPFAIRLRGDLRVTTEEGHELTLNAHLRGRGRGRVLEGWLGVGKDRGRNRLSFAAKPLGRGEWLVVATNVRPRTALDAYRKRWAIENLFGDTKTRGLNLKPAPGLTRGYPTHGPRQARPADGPRSPCHRLGGTHSQEPPRHQMAKRRAHGYLEKSWFRTGFDLIRNLLRSDPLKAIAPWSRIAAKHTKISRVV